MTTPLAASASPARGAALARLGDLVLSTDALQRRCLALQLLAGLITLVGIGLTGIGAGLGLFATRPVILLCALALGMVLCFYVIVRSGLNRLYADPTLAYPHTIAAQTLTAIAYAILAPVHSSLLILPVVVLVFGMFNMRAAALRAVCLYTLAVMGAAMVWRARSAPQLYPAELECFNFALLATVLLAVTSLSSQLVGLRLRLKQQKQALEQALVQIRELATHDELTGLPNRRHLAGLLDEHAGRRARGGPPFFVGVIDLDHFKQINDAHGHATGDEALRSFAAQARAALRNTDIIGRWGGEEFLLILPGNVPDEAGIALTRLRAALAATPACAAVPSLRVAFSCGLTHYRSGESPCQAVERADHALYRAKAQGRGQTVFA